MRIMTVEIFHDQSLPKYGARLESNLRPLDQLLASLQIALPDPENISCSLITSTVVFALSILDCGSKYSIAHAHIDFNGTTTYGSKSLVKCQGGFDILGPKYITCLPDGTWSRDTACYVRSKY